MLVDLTLALERKQKARKSAENEEEAYTVKDWSWILKVGNSCEGAESELYLEITGSSLSRDS